METGFNSSTLGQFSPASIKPLGLNVPGKNGGDFDTSLAAKVGAMSKPEEAKGIVGEFIDGVDAKQQVASESRRSFLAGESNNLHQTMIAGQESSVAFSLMVEMRNKVMEAYQELMRIQI